MRSLLTLILVVDALIAIGCPPPRGTECSVSADCGPGLLCVDGSCIKDPAGVAREGEGEGDAAEGEGEGQAGEGEGEGQGGEGEGEGEGDPGVVCTPACGQFQQCTDEGGPAGVCEYIGDVCDTFDASTISVFATQSKTLDATTAHLYEFDGLERLERAHRVTGATAGMKLRVTVTSTALDPILYVFDDSIGTCQIKQQNDDITPGTNLNSQLVIDYATLFNADLLVTSFGNGTGAYTIETRPLLCNLPTDSLATYNECRGPLEVQGCTHNPCANLDANGNTTGHLCCVSSSCRSGFGTGGNIAIVFDSNPAGACHP